MLRGFKKLPGLILVCVISLFPLIIDINVSDMTLSVRYLALNILFLTFLIFNKSSGYSFEVLKSPIVKVQGLLIIILILSSTINGWTVDALYTLNRVLVVLFSFIFFSNILINYKLLLFAKSVLIFSSSLILIYFFQISLITDLSIMSLEGISSTMGNKNLLASILFLTSPFLFFVFISSSSFWKVFSAIVLILILFCLLIIQAKATLLGLIIMVFIIILFNFSRSLKKVLYYSTFFMVIISIFFFLNPIKFDKINREYNQLTNISNNLFEKEAGKNNSRIILYFYLI